MYLPILDTYIRINNYILHQSGTLMCHLFPLIANMYVYKLILSHTFTQFYMLENHSPSYYYTSSLGLGALCFAITQSNFLCVIKINMLRQPKWK